MGVAAMAKNLHSFSIWIQPSLNRIYNFSIKARPTAMGIEFLGREIKRSIAPFADVDPRVRSKLINAGSGAFRPMMFYDAALFSCQIVVTIHKTLRMQNLNFHIS